QSSPQSNLQFYPCPTGYCRCRHDDSVSNETCVYSYSHSDPDYQCACSRRGTLCGECRDDEKGVSSLLNNCVTCDDASGLLILLLIVVDVVVMAILVLLDKPLPSWLYPFIFYFQIAPIVALDFPDSFTKIAKYVSHSLLMCTTSMKKIVSLLDRQCGKCFPFLTSCTTVM
ncbi:hypothetical protein GBAR_LOCUS31080, partial [Geodia barretti]